MSADRAAAEPEGTIAPSDEGRFAVALARIQTAYDRCLADLPELEARGEAAQDAIERHGDRIEQAVAHQQGEVRKLWRQIAALSSRLQGRIASTRRHVDQTIGRLERRSRRLSQWLWLLENRRWIVGIARIVVAFVLLFLVWRYGGHAIAFVLGILPDLQLFLPAPGGEAA